MQHDPHQPAPRTKVRELDLRPAILLAGLLLAVLLLLL
jgi:hypothetical protein